MYGAAIFYCCLLTISIFRHEPWADEAQAWLLARDSNLLDLWTHLLHYEGTPGIWHTLLLVLVRAGLPYGGLNVVSGVFGAAAAWMLIRYAPFPLPVRLSLPFTFFLAYQYPGVARSYSIVPLLLFGCAAIYKNGVQRIGLFTFLVCAMAGLSLHALVLSVSIWVAFHIDVVRDWGWITASTRKKLLVAGAVYVAWALVMIAAAWPAKDVAFPYHVDFSLGHFVRESGSALNEAFAGQPVASLAAIALSLPFLWRGNGLGVFLISSVLLCAASSLVYGNVWHHGILFLAWLFAVWISATNTKPTWPILTALAIVIVFQCYWTVDSWRYDWQRPYSGGSEAAMYLQKSGIAGGGVFCAGFPCAGVQPYFYRNEFTNFDHSYWDWSSKNRADDPTPLLSSKAPEFALIGYKMEAERIRWTNLVNIAGYRNIRHFEGGVFWRTRILQPETFDLYQRGTPGPMMSSIDMANPVAARQLLSGFYALENHAWRWTARRFSLALAAPPEASTKGATLLLHFYVPEAQAKKLGPVTLIARVDNVPLRPETFSGSDTFTYSRDVPADILQPRIIPVSFSFDKSVPPGGAEARELAAVVASVELRTR
jgi:hypothetical protein